MKFLCVKVGDKYSTDTVNKLFNNLNENYSGEIDLYCLTDNQHGFISNITPLPIQDEWKKLQWHKTTFFQNRYNGFDNGEEVIVCDIDIEIIKNIDDLVEYNFETFVGSHRWWHTSDGGKLSGSLYKFRIGELSKVYDEFNPEWQEHWVKNKLVEPPVNGEQNYVEMMVGSSLELFPFQWFTKWTTDEERNNRILNDFGKLTGEILKIENEWHEDLKVIHYAGFGK